jgi:hypothetical protein
MIESLLPPRICREISKNKTLVDLVAKGAPRFGRLIAEMGPLGQIRKQKKAPYTEILYVWVMSGGVPALRSANNCSDEQLTLAIQDVGETVEHSPHLRSRAERVLDLLYAELARRV